MSIVEIRKKALTDAFNHNSTDVKLFDELGNSLGLIRAIIASGEITEPYSGAVNKTLYGKFLLSEFPQHRQGLKIHSWRGDFSLFTVIDKNEITVSYSLQQE